MSNNINHEVVYPPAINNLRRMSYQSPASKGRKGSYELYHPEHKSLESPERIAVNSIAGSAPGSPSSLQDFNQVVERLQQELEQSKRKESELQQMLTELKNPMNSMYLDTSYLEESPSNDHIGGNVKDAHIRHLQRQVTVLQASLYKSEGWSNRVSAAVKERDKALDEVAHLTSRIREMQDINSQLLHKIESLNTTLQAAHENLQQATEQLQNHQYNGQLVSHLKDEIHRQGCEIKALKENHNQLDLENKGLKDFPGATNCQSGSSLTCSQELEHLHKVVDRLKSTVLQQRSYLLQLRQPINDGSTKSLNSSSILAVTDSLLDRDSVMRRNSSSPKLRVSGYSPVASEVRQRSLPHHDMVVHKNQPVIVKSRGLKENMDIQQVHCRSSSDFVQDGLVGGRRISKPHEILMETFNVHNSSNPSAAQGGEIAGIESRHIPQLASRRGYIYPSSSQNPSPQQTKGDMSVQNLVNIGENVTNGYGHVKSPQHVIVKHKGNHAEIDHRIGADVVSQNKLSNKSDAYDWQMRQWSLASANNSAALSANKTRDYLADHESPLNQGQRYKPPMHVQQETKINEASTIPLEGPAPHKLTGNAMQLRHTQFGNLHLNPATSKPEQIYHPTPSYAKESVFTINNDMMSGGKMKITASPSHSSVSHRGSQQVVYINTPGDQGSHIAASTVSTSVDQNPSRTKLDSDRLCPVCSNDYSHLTVEEFQTHIFECFDDENPPETMKLIEAPDRSCPMCNVRFSTTVPQAEYEKHVHSHFGDETPGANFVILQP